MLKVPCPRCGKLVDKLIRGVCPQCFAETYGIIIMPKIIKAEICRYCGSIRVGGRWVRVYSFDEAIETLARYIIKHSKPVEPLQRIELLRLEYETKPDWTTRLTLHLRGYYEDLTINGTSKVEVHLKPSICPVCKIRVSGEYDTLLQIRGIEANKIKTHIEKSILKTGLEGQLVDVIESKKGLDIYFTNVGAARKLVRELAKRFNLKLHEAEYETVGMTSSGRRRSRKTLVVRIDESKEEI